jgi:hypothetical protein
MKLKALLRDDFVDDPGMEPDADNPPVKLPMLTSGYIFNELVTVACIFLFQKLDLIGTVYVYCNATWKF